MLHFNCHFNSNWIYISPHIESANWVASWKIVFILLKCPRFKELNSNAEMNFFRWKPPLVNAVNIEILILSVMCTEPSQSKTKLMYFYIFVYLCMALYWKPEDMIFTWSQIVLYISVFFHWILHEKLHQTIAPEPERVTNK